jgi:hypothetical protein
VKPMAWIKVDTATFTSNPRIKLTARDLGVEPGVIGWAWIHTLTHAGRIGSDDGSLPVDHVEIVAEWTGKPGDLVAALLRSGLLLPRDDGAVGIAGWDELTEAWRRTQEDLRADADRKRKARERTRESDRPEDVRRTSAGRPRMSASRSEGEGEGETERDSLSRDFAPAYTDVPGLTPGESEPSESRQRPLAEPTVDDRPRGGGAVSPGDRSARQEAPRAEDVVELYNAAATEAGWPKVAKLTPARRTAVKARIRDDSACRDPAWWRDYFARAARAPHLRGENDRRWCADFDWLLKPENLQRVSEGRYDPSSRPAPAKVAPMPPRGVDFAERVRARRAGGDA